MSHSLKIKSALISVFYKDSLAPLVQKLSELGVEVYSTGGTKKFIEEQGVPVVAVEELTSYPSILGGRVKTLHPKVFGGILARRENQEDIAQLEEYSIPEIDLVIVDLYPFEQTVREGGSEPEVIEKIDIGGISLIRAAAKNYQDTLVVSSRGQYGELLSLLNEKAGYTDLADRKKFAADAFKVSSQYDTAIYSYFTGITSENNFKRSYSPARGLRYGENPHQQGTFYGDLEQLFEQLHGKELSFNNLVDIDAAIGLINEFDETTFAILKHTNPCGVAVSDTVLEAYQRALAGDPVSAFGGVMICNRPVDKSTAEEVNKIFLEVLIAPGYDAGALDILKSKKNRIILKQKMKKIQDKQFKSLLNGVIEQDYDKTETANELKTVTKEEPDESQKADLRFANKIVKHLKSNAIVLAKDKQLVGMGCGQTSRVDALKQAISKAKSFELELKGAVMASDAFFPFPDCVEIAGQQGIKTVIQPGGSIKDQDSIDYCNAHNMSMVFTGFRHFRH